MIDVLAEEIVLKVLEDRGVSCVLVSEECGIKKLGEGESIGYVIIDGIDGTTNAVQGLPFVATSLAFAEGPHLKDVKMGLVMDFSRDTIFHAEKGRGAFQDDKRLKTSSVTTLRNAVISFELGYQCDREKQIRSLTPLLVNSKKIRFLGSTALELCYIASGALDAFIDVRGAARATDLAAAQLILAEAGGLSVTSIGHPLNITLKATSKVSIISTSTLLLCNNILEKLKVNQNKG